MQVLYWLLAVSVANSAILSQTGNIEHSLALCL